MTKNSVLQLRITDNQKDRWQRLAAAEHRTLTDWITQTLELAYVAAIDRIDSPPPVEAFEHIEDDRPQRDPTPPSPSTAETPASIEDAGAPTPGRQPRQRPRNQTDRPPLDLIPDDLTEPEYAALYHKLDQQGYSVREIAAVSPMHSRATIGRRLQKTREEAATHPTP